MTHSEQVEALIEQFQKSGIRELHLRINDFEIHLSSSSVESDIGAAATALVTTTPAPSATSRRLTAAAPKPAESPPQAAPQAANWPAGSTVVRAPYLGTFYRAPKPGATPYVEVGSPVSPETEICMIEVMKLFTAVHASISGRVHAVLASDGQLVDAQQPLFVLVPL